MLQQKEQFLKNEYIPLLQQLEPGRKGNWGKMDGQQMIEHMRDVFKVASGRIALPLLTSDPVQLEKLRAFIMTEAPFRENTKMPLMPEEPRAHKYNSISEAISKMQPELDAVFETYGSDAHKTVMNPMFGELNYEQQIHLLHKHALHHLRQFGLVD